MAGLVPYYEYSKGKLTVEEYLKWILIKNKSNVITINDIRLNRIKNILKAWSGKHLNEIKASGSTAKGTSVAGIADFDIFVSLSSKHPWNLKEIYKDLDNYLLKYGYKTKKQNVSIRITENGIDIDIVPGKEQDGSKNYHSIYSYKKDSWLKTNIDLHINNVLESNRVDEIILTKIWKHINNLDFPSIYIELVVLNALNGKKINNLKDNFIYILRYLNDLFVDKVIYDPANTNNIISDTLYQYEKFEIARKANESLNKESWTDIIF